MASRITCIANAAFEDQLTPGSSYQLIKADWSGVTIINDKGEQRCYGTGMFKFPM